MKKILIAILALAALHISTVDAATYGRSFMATTTAANSIIAPLFQWRTAPIWANNFVATSTTATSTFNGHIDVIGNLRAQGIQNEGIVFGLPGGILGSSNQLTYSSNTLAAPNLYSSGDIYAGSSVTLDYMTTNYIPYIGGVSGTQIVGNPGLQYEPGTQTLTAVNADIGDLTVDDVLLPGFISQDCLGTDSSGHITVGTCSGGSGTNFFTNSGATTSLNTGSIVAAGSFVATSTTATTTIYGHISQANINPVYTATSTTLTTDSSGWTGYTIRNVINTAQISNREHTYMRIRVSAPVAYAMGIGSMAVGTAASSGDAYDYDSAPYPVTFNGKKDLYLAAGQVAYSDYIPFQLAAGKNLITSTYLTSPGGLRYRTPGLTGTNPYYKAGDETYTINATGYTNYIGVASMMIVDRIETIDDFGNMLEVTNQVGSTTLKIDNFGALNTNLIKYSNGLAITDSTSPNGIGSTTFITTKVGVGGTYSNGNYGIRWSPTQGEAGDSGLFWSDDTIDYAQLRLDVNHGGSANSAEIQLLSSGDIAIIPNNQFSQTGGRIQLGIASVANSRVTLQQVSNAVSASRPNGYSNYLDFLVPYYSGSIQSVGIGMRGEYTGNSAEVAVYNPGIDYGSVFPYYDWVGTTTRKTAAFTRTGFWSTGLVVGTSTTSGWQSTTTPPVGGAIFQNSIGIGTSSPGTPLSLGNTGNDTINISPTGTSTFGSGINLRTGCFAVNGTCIGGGGGSGTNFFSNSGATTTLNTGSVVEAGNFNATSTTATTTIAGPFTALLNPLGQGAFRVSNSPDTTVQFLTANKTVSGFTTSQYTDITGLTGTTSVAALALAPKSITTGTASTSLISSLAVKSFESVSSSNVNFTSATVYIEDDLFQFGSFTTQPNYSLLVDNGMSRFDDQVLIGTSSQSSTQPMLRIQASGSTIRTLDIASSTGSSVFTINTNDNVGIGTTSPYAKLSVVGDVVGQSFIASTTANNFSGALGSATTPTYAFNGDSNTGIFSETADRLNFVTNGTSRWYINSSGTLFSPTGSAVSTTGTLFGGAYFYSTDTDSGFSRLADGVLGLTNNGNTSNYFFSANRTGFGSTTPLARLSASSTVDVTAIFDQQGTSDILQLRDSGQVVFVVQDGGKVGIGTTTPQATLAVEGLIQTNEYTVATLPTCNSLTRGSRAHVTDASAPTFLTALTGGGAVVAPAFCNGTTWVAD